MKSVDCSAVALAKRKASLVCMSSTRVMTVMNTSYHDFATSVSSK